MGRPTQVRDTLALIQERQRLANQIHQMNQRQAAIKVTTDHAQRNGWTKDELNDALGALGLT